VEKYVGPMVLKADGTIDRKTTTPAEAEVVVKRSIAGACYAQFHAGGTLAATFWMWLRQAA